MNGIFFFVSEEIATSPADGYALANRWWTVHPEKGVCFYATRKRPYGLEPGEADEPSPQCNSNEATARHLQQRFHPDCITKQIPVVFMNRAVKEMYRQRKAVAESEAVR